MPITRRELCDLLPVLLPLFSDVKVFAAEDQALSSGAFSFGNAPMHVANNNAQVRGMQGASADGLGSAAIVLTGGTLGKNTPDLVGVSTRKRFFLSARPLHFYTPIARVISEANVHAHVVLREETCPALNFAGDTSISHINVNASSDRVTITLNPDQLYQ